MSIEDVWGYVLSAVISAIVAILLTGKITAGLADRAAARRLRSRATRVLLVGPGREQQGWWYLSPKQTQDIANRLVVLSEDAIAIDLVAARSYAHAAQMLPVLARCIENWRDDSNEAQKRIDDASPLAGGPIGPQPDKVTRIFGSLVRRRDNALAAVATIYEELLTADASLARVKRWLRVVDWTPRLSAPRTFVAALRYAQDHLRGADTWREPSTSGLEAYRVQTIAKQMMPHSPYRDANIAVARRDIVGDEPIAFEDGRYIA